MLPLRRKRLLKTGEPWLCLSCAYASLVLLIQAQRAGSNFLITVIRLTEDKGVFFKDKIHERSPRNALRVYPEQRLLLQAEKLRKLWSAENEQRRHGA
jgi:hypothetical protein